MDSASPKKSRTLRQKFRRGFLLYALVPYLSVIVIFAVLQRRLMYRQTVAASLAIDDVGLSAEFGVDVELSTPDGNTIRGWLVSGRDEQTLVDVKRPLVLYFPGHSLNRSERASDLQEVARRGFDVLIFDYRGFGDSTGSPTESAITADALLAWQYVIGTLGYEQSRVVIFGESLGGAVALSLWSDENPTPPQPAALILNSTFASMSQVVG
ncbi:MAG: alpha/beta hydrolase, partial [Planctomycetaceae bacterium]